MKRSGASTEFIQEALGHTNIKTAENYLGSFEKEIKKSLRINWFHSKQKYHTKQLKSMTLSYAIRKVCNGSNDHKYYAFYGEGPKGRIRKVIYYQKLKHFGENVFNLTFGDWNEKE